MGEWKLLTVLTRSESGTLYLFLISCLRIKTGTVEGQLKYLTSPCFSASFLISAALRSSSLSFDELLWSVLIGFWLQENKVYTLEYLVNLYICVSRFLIIVTCRDDIFLLNNGRVEQRNDSIWYWVLDNSDGEQWSAMTQQYQSPAVRCIRELM